MIPGTTPAMNSVPTEVLVATEYITMTIEGGIRIPNAPEVVMTPAPNRFGKPALTIAGSMIDPIATTVAGLNSDTAANNAQAMTPARPRPPCQWPTMVVANVIMRRATPPWVRKLPARMKNGIAMISNRSMPVNSLSATDSIGTWVIVNRNVSTVRPSEIDTGMPVSISANSRTKMIHALLTSTPTSFSTMGMAIRTGGISAGQRGAFGGYGRTSVVIALPLGQSCGMQVVGQGVRVDVLGLFDAFDVGDLVVRQLTGAPERPGDLQETEAHQVGAERDRQKHDPHRHFHVGRDLVGMGDFPDELCAERADDAREHRAGEQAEHE